MSRKIIVSGVGCCLVDLLYNNINFNCELFRPFLSRRRGDGGITPGQLVFQEEFEKFCGQPFEEAIDNITRGKVPEAINIGGPSIVSLINLAQLTGNENCEVRFYGRGGNDEIGQYLHSALAKTPVVLKDYQLIDNRTPSTVVLSDPKFDNGHGERAFLNSIGAAWDFTVTDLDDDFFKSDIVVFGGTALVPQIHDKLTSLLKKAKSGGCITVVNTVFDFRNEKANPSQKWPIGENDESYQYIDLLITDLEEALRLSGEQNAEKTTQFFVNKGVSSILITNGARDITCCSDGKLFGIQEISYMPVSQKVKFDLEFNHEGDTTGCGDNFVGGVLTSIVMQLNQGIEILNLEEACSWGIVSGGFTCFYMGGTYLEQQPGEKLTRIQPYYDAYREQVGC